MDKVSGGMQVYYYIGVLVYMCNIRCYPTRPLLHRPHSPNVVLAHTHSFTGSPAKRICSTSYTRCTKTTGYPSSMWCYIGHGLCVANSACNDSHNHHHHHNNNINNNNNRDMETLMKAFPNQPLDFFGAIRCVCEWVHYIVGTRCICKIIICINF